MSTQLPETTTKAKSRRSLLPPLNFASPSCSSASSCSNTTSSHPSRPPPMTSAALSSAAEPDYFASIHLPDTNPPKPAAVQIASPFAFATPLVSASGARPPPRANGPGAAAHDDSQDREQHPWAKLFPEAGMATALPDSFLIAPLALPPTPIANHSSVTSKMQQQDGSQNSIPSDFRRNLNLPARLNGSLSSNASLPLPPCSSSNNKASASKEDLSKFKALDVDGLAEVLSPPSCKMQRKASPSALQPATPQDVLVLDIRPSTSYSMARVASSINICAPSTLLKRPAITVERIENEMLASVSDRRHFMRWRKGPLKPKPDAKASPKDQASLEAVRKRDATICLPDEPGVNKIIVLDTDTCRIDGTGNATAGGGGPCLIGVLKKFEAAGFAGELCWLVGGFNKLARSNKAQQFIDTGVPQKGADIAISGHDQTPSQSRQNSKPPTFKLNGVVATPSFESPASSYDQRKSLVQPRGLPMEAFNSHSTIPGWMGQTGTSPANDLSQRNSGEHFQFNLAARQQDESHNGSNTQHGAQAGAQNRSSANCANPFFDNIRQNRELQHGITEKIPMDLPQMSELQVQQLPPFLQKLVYMPDADRALALAQAFFDIEKAEQNRLIAIMQQHSAESEQDPRSKDFASAQAAALQKRSSAETGRYLDPNSHAFPFSIAAALERGADNRYNNIWTYEHSRVRLSKPQSTHDPGSDYINGSHVQPSRRLGTKRRYIATQAPLPSTFDAFWTAVWEQNSRVIVMLTREHESGRLQSHPYWLKSEFGDSIRLTKLEEVVLNEAGQQMRPEQCDGLLNNESHDGRALFPTMPSQPSSQQKQGVDASDKKREPTTVRRTLLLQNLSEPQSAPRRIVQLQYIAWPDYHIPETPESLLTLMDIADGAQNSADAELQSSVSLGRGVPAAGPMVVHCSAGVGRTGAFIVIDAALDVLRRARRRQKLGPSSNGSSAEPATWENNIVSVTATGNSSNGIGGNSPMADVGTREVDMAPVSSPLGDRFPRTTRRSLKRELSSTGMDIDSGSNQGSGSGSFGRDLSSPSSMFRSRSNESGSGLDAASNPSSSVSSTGSSPFPSKDTPMRTSQSMQQQQQQQQQQTTAEGGFTNPFTIATFRFNPTAAARVDGVGGNNQGSSTRHQGQGSSTGSGATDPAFAPTRGQTLQLGGQDGAWRQASSPFSEVSTPSRQDGGSARSSFSSAAGTGLHSRFSSSNGLSPTGAGERSIEEALMSAMNPFDFAISPQSETGSSDIPPNAATAGDISTITGSNEPTPFDAASCCSADVFFSRHEGSEGVSASNSANSTLANSTSSASAEPHTRNTWIHCTRGNSNSHGEGQMLEARNHSQLSVAEGGAVEQVLEKGEDVIKAIVEGVREQRMSLIQTGRQFVFVYSAVLAGLLRDLRWEGVN
ncbi:hypothetical protein NDA18_005999 [Ustilago nuda]|nr:hypothetical protein NDA18_005999 [Ustilago nuda]